MLHERLGFSPEVIEAQLAHSVRDSLGRAYNRTEFTEQRRSMLQAWADYLDQLRIDGEAVPMRAPALKAFNRAGVRDCNTATATAATGTGIGTGRDAGGGLGIAFSDGEA